MSNTKNGFSAKQLRIIRFGGVLIFIGSFIFAFIFTGNDRFLKRCVANGNTVKYCNDIYDNRNLAFQKEQESIEKKFDLKSKNLLKALDNTFAKVHSDSEAIDFLITSGKHKLWDDVFLREKEALKEIESFKGGKYVSEIKKSFYLL